MVSSQPDERKKRTEKTSQFAAVCAIIMIEGSLFFRTGAQKREVFHMKKKVTRKEARERLVNLRMGVELVKGIRHFFLT